MMGDIVRVTDSSATEITCPDAFRSSITGLLLAHEAVEQKLAALERKHNDRLSELNAAIDRHDEAITKREEACIARDIAVAELQAAHAGRDHAKRELETASQDIQTLQSKVELFLHDRNEALDNLDKAWSELAAEVAAHEATTTKLQALEPLRAQVQTLQVAHAKELAEVTQAKHDTELKYEHLSEAVEKLLKTGACLGGQSFGSFGLAMEGVREAAKKIKAT